MRGDSHATAAERMLDMFETAIQPLFEKSSKEFLSEARSIARLLALKNGSVTVDDVRNICPPPNGVDPRVMGAVLKSKDFICVGHRKSGRGECHHRPIGVFKLAGAQ